MCFLTNSYIISLRRKLWILNKSEFVKYKSDACQCPIFKNHFKYDSLYIKTIQNSKNCFCRVTGLKWFSRGSFSTFYVRLPPKVTYISVPREFVSPPLKKHSYFIILPWIIKAKSLGTRLADFCISATVYSCDILASYPTSACLSFICKMITSPRPLK